MSKQLARTELLLGSEKLGHLWQQKVAVFGVGGVGSYVIEALVRSGIGQIDIIDDDYVCESNINRQIIALHSTIGQAKVDAMKARINDINPDINVKTYKVFVGTETIGQFDFNQYDYIVDAIDTVSAKLLLIEKAKEAQKPVISCMGVGNKLHPELLEITDIAKTSICPLAKVMRKELKNRHIKKVKVLYSKELPLKHHQEATTKSKEDKGSLAIRTGNPKRHTPGSIAFVPSTAGLMIAGEVIREMCQI